MENLEYHKKGGGVVSFAPATLVCANERPPPSPFLFFLFFCFNFDQIMREGIEEWKGIISSTQAPDEREDFLVQALSDVLANLNELDSFPYCLNNDEQRAFLLWLLENGVPLTSDDFAGFAAADSNKSTTLTSAVLAKFPNLHRGPAAKAAAKKGCTAVIEILFGDGKAKEYRAKTEEYLARLDCSVESEREDKEALTDALIELCKYASASYTEMLVLAGADVNGYADTNPEETPLFACMKEANAEQANAEFTARMLLEHGANPDIGDGMLLAFAAQKKDDDLALLLIEFKASNPKNATAAEHGDYLEIMRQKFQNGERTYL